MLSRRLNIPNIFRYNETEIEIKDFLVKLNVNQQVKIDKLIKKYILKA